MLSFNRDELSESTVSSSLASTVPVVLYESFPVSAGGLAYLKVVVPLLKPPFDKGWLRSVRLPYLLREFIYL